MYNHLKLQQRHNNHVALYRVNNESSQEFTSGLRITSKVQPVLTKKIQAKNKTAAELI